MKEKVWLGEEVTRLLSARALLAKLLIKGLRLEEKKISEGKQNCPPARVLAPHER